MVYSRWGGTGESRWGGTDEFLEGRGSENLEEGYEYLGEEGCSIWERGFGVPGIGGLEYLEEGFDYRALRRGAIRRKKII